MAQSNEPVYRKLTREVLALAPQLVDTLQNNTQPIGGHTDPASIQDCWKSLREIVGLMQVEINNGWAYEANVSQALNEEDGVYRP